MTETPGVKVALMGAGGKMGGRIADNLRDSPRYSVAYVEAGDDGRKRLAEKGLAATPPEEALAGADAVIMALPDRRIGAISREIVPRLEPGAMLVGLDPAALYAEVVPLRDDLTYFVTHPCHPPVFHDEVTPEARSDLFGGVVAKHHIVCALHRGPEAHYDRGERLARDMYAPVMNAYRVTVEQMAILEPALAETFTATVITAIKEALDEAVRMGVPREAAEAFLMGHVRVPLAIVFGYADFPFSDGAKLAIAEAYDTIFREGWKEAIFDLDALRASVRRITGAA